MLDGIERAGIAGDDVGRASSGWSNALYEDGTGRKRQGLEVVAEDGAVGVVVFNVVMRGAGSDGLGSVGWDVGDGEVVRVVDSKPGEAVVFDVDLCRERRL